MDEVLEFINKRFKNDCEWVTGNCYYFALILKDRFPKGEIYYDTIWGHFLLKYKDKYYDWKGVYNQQYSNFILWENFDKYDSNEKQRILRDCIM